MLRGVKSLPNLALEIERLSKSFSGVTVLSNVSLTVKPGEVRALVGQNGSGKSTLIKVLSGYHEPDQGSSVRVSGVPLQFGAPAHSYRLGCRFVHQELGLVTTETILDNLAMGFGYPTRLGTIRHKKSLAEANELLTSVGLTVDPMRPLSSLGAAQRTEVAVARALRYSSTNPPHVLVLDEPTATLPLDEVDELLSTIRAVAATGIAVLYVSHHLEEVYRIASSVSVLRDGLLVGTYQVNQIDHGTLVELLVGPDSINEKSIRKSFDADRRQDPVLSVRGLHSDSLEDVSFSVYPGEIVGIAGLTGSGRESVLGAVFGASSRYEGQVAVSSTRLKVDRPDLSIRAGMGYLPSDRKLHSGVMSMSAQENFTLPDLRSIMGPVGLSGLAERKVTSDWFARLNVKPVDSLEFPLSILSGGNQQKVLFAKWLRLNLAVLLLDDPTQGIDVGAKIQLHNHLIDAARAGIAVIFSSTDIDEIVSLSNRVFIFRDGRLSDVYEGNRLNAQAITKAIMTTESKQDRMAYERP
jgi:ribose transport system ATP-binding protein